MGLCLVYSGAVLQAGSVEVSADVWGDCDSKHATVVFMKSGKNFKKLYATIFLVKIKMI